jgi:hypothetical protein
MVYEYKVVPAPLRGLKAKGLRTPEERFANALQVLMNEQADTGWEYLRTDTLPSEQREGLMSKTTVYQNMLVFRRQKHTAATTGTRREPDVTTAPKALDESGTKEPLMLEKQGTTTAATTTEKPVTKSSGSA